jgi:hypothetical protein
VDWIQLAQYRVEWKAPVNTVINLRVPWNEVNFWTSSSKNPRAAISRIISRTTAKSALVVAKATAEKQESENGVLIFRLRKSGRDLWRHYTSYVHFTARPNSPCLLDIWIEWNSTELICSMLHIAARASVICWGTVLQAGRPPVQFPMGSTDFFNWSNPFSRTMVLGSTQPLTEMGTRNLPGGKGRTARKADNLTAICEPTV